MTDTIMERVQAIKNLVQKWDSRIRDKISFLGEFSVIRNNLYLLSAYTGGGKTTNLILASVMAIEEGKTVLIVSNEIPKDYYYKKFLELNNRIVEDEDVEKTYQKMAKGFFVYDNQDADFSDCSSVWKNIKAFIRLHNPDLVFFDQISNVYLKNSSIESYRPMKMVTSEILREFDSKGDLPPIVVTQQGDDPNDFKGTSKSALRGSRDTVADCRIHFHSIFNSEEGAFEISVLKDSFHLCEKKEHSLPVFEGWKKGV